MVSKLTVCCTQVLINRKQTSQPTTVYATSCSVTQIFVAAFLSGSTPMHKTYLETGLLVNPRPYDVFRFRSQASQRQKAQKERHARCHRNDNARRGSSAACKGRDPAQHLFAHAQLLLNNRSAVYYRMKLASLRQTAHNQSLIPGTRYTNTARKRALLVKVILFLANVLAAFIS